MVPSIYKIIVVQNYILIKGQNTVVEYPFMMSLQFVLYATIFKNFKNHYS